MYFVVVKESAVTEQAKYVNVILGSRLMRISVGMSFRAAA
jgi:hypothetical protein